MAAPDLSGLGAFVRDRRHALGLTQQQLGERIDWVQERVSLLERGRYGLPSLIILARLADALGTPLSQLLAALGYGEVLDTTVGQIERESPRAAVLLYTIERILAIQAITLRDAMHEACDVAAQAMGADVVEVYLLHPSSSTLVALGCSTTALAGREHEIGLGELSLDENGRLIEVFKTGELYTTGHAERDPRVRRDLRHDVGIRSLLATPLQYDGRRIGILVAESTTPERFSEDEFRFFLALTHWVELIAHRAQLLERHTSES